MTSVDPRKVVAKDIGHRFPPAPFLFNDISFELRPNEVYALVGPSGSGKSTLLSMLAGWVRPTSGTLDLSYINVISWVFQNPHGVANRLAVDHVALPLIAKGRTHSKAREQARALIELVGLGVVENAPFKHLSGGEAQRLMLARGLAASPDLLLVVEPTAQLDQHTADAVNHAIAAISGQGAIVVVATHDSRTRDACTSVITLADNV